MKKGDIIRVSSISQMHRLFQQPKPLHPLISLLDIPNLDINLLEPNHSYLFDFYSISYKYSKTGKIGYGQKDYDFAEGGLVFMQPGQLFFNNGSVGGEVLCEGFTLMFHRDLLRNFPLASTIKNYGYFSYDKNEALHLSEKEKTKIIGLTNNIRDELDNAIDDLSQEVLVSYLTVLLTYCYRFYKRQFVTRKVVNHDTLSKMENLLNMYFEDGNALDKGLPSVEYIAGKLHLSPHYLSDMLRTLIGQNTQQVIHGKLIEKAKEKLSTSNLSVSEIAYELGFEHPQSFNKLFKKKTNLTPMEFKQSLS